MMNADSYWYCILRIKYLVVMVELFRTLDDVQVRLMDEPMIRPIDSTHAGAGNGSSPVNSSFIEGFVARSALGSFACYALPEES